jgi:hypothetical protein
MTKLNKPRVIEVAPSSVVGVRELSSREMCLARILAETMKTAGYSILPIYIAHRNEEETYGLLGNPVALEAARLAQLETISAFLLDDMDAGMQLLWHDFYALRPEFLTPAIGKSDYGTARIEIAKTDEEGNYTVIDETDPAYPELPV